MDAEPVTPDAFLIFRPEVALRVFRPYANISESLVACCGWNAPLADTSPSSFTPGHVAVSDITPVPPKGPETMGPAMSPRRPVLRRSPGGVPHIPFRQSRKPGRREPGQGRNGALARTCRSRFSRGKTFRVRNLSPEQPSPLRRYLSHRADHHTRPSEDGPMCGEQPGCTRHTRHGFPHRAPEHRCEPPPRGAVPKDHVRLLASPRPEPGLAALLTTRLSVSTAPACPLGADPAAPGPSQNEGPNPAETRQHTNTCNRMFRRKQIRGQCAIIARMQFSVQNS